MSRTHPKPERSGATSRTTPPKSTPAKGTSGRGARGARPAQEAPAAARPAKPAKPAGPPAALAAHGLTKDYGDLVALAPLDLRVETGQAVVLVGHNGSGKTTLLRIAAGLLEPSEGEVTIAGNAAGSLPARAAVSYLSDSPTFYEDLSVWEHLEYTAGLHGLDDWEQTAADLLGLLGLYPRADDLPVQFSRGLRQKAAIAIGLLRPFDVLLVDEPFVGLDAAGKAAFLELLDEEADRGRTLLVATHELEFVKRVERCLALRDGELIYDGTTDGVDVLSLVS
jgi:ABC-2 type transport system ATP-binding protein